jgi:non-canonical poly(A) RNA polymerase PAPD5/7
MSDRSAPIASTSDSRRSRKRGSSKKKKETSLSAETPTLLPAPPSFLPAKPAELGDDFLPFELSESESDAQAPPRPTREWDEGKPEERDRKGKRKDRGYEREDGYENKKQRVNAASRRAPWVVDVEWERCSNVAEMCVSRRMPVHRPLCCK